MSKIYYIILGALVLILCASVSLLSVLKAQEPQEEKVYININGEPVEVVIDDYENLYLKYNIKGETIYIPYPFLTEEEQENNFENQFTSK